jgi:hypothetical protein
MIALWVWDWDLDPPALPNYYFRCDPQRLGRTNTAERWHKIPCYDPVFTMSDFEDADRI